jgi:hypothetical protein
MKSFVLFIPPTVLLGWSYRRMMRWTKHATSNVGGDKCMHYFGGERDLGICGRLIFKWISKKEMV